MCVPPPPSSQYGWAGSEASLGEYVLDSGKASDLSVCSWPIEPIQWTPFPLLQQLANHRTAPRQVRVNVCVSDGAVWVCVFDGALFVFDGTVCVCVCVCR